MSARAVGTPFKGSVSLTNGAPGPVNIPIVVVPGGSAYTLGTNERLIITNIAISSNDTATPTITLDDGASSPTTIGKYYTSVSLPAIVESCFPGSCQGQAGKLVRATASAVTTAKTVEITIRGFVSQTA